MEEIFWTVLLNKYIFHSHLMHKKTLLMMVGSNDGSIILFASTILNWKDAPHFFCVHAWSGSICTRWWKWNASQWAGMQYLMGIDMIKRKLWWYKCRNMCRRILFRDSILLKWIWRYVEFLSKNVVIEIFYLASEINLFVWIGSFAVDAESDLVWIFLWNRKLIKSQHENSSNQAHLSFQKI